MAEKEAVKKPTLQEALLGKLTKRFAPFTKTVRKKNRPQLDKLLGVVAKEIAVSWETLNTNATKSLQDMLYQQRVHYSELICPLCNDKVPRTEFNGRTVHYCTTREAAANPHPDEDSIVRVRCAASSFWSLT